jgi:molecular chaperone HscA
MTDTDRTPEPVLGIDLGTTNSLVAIADATGPRVLVPDGASPIVPSVVRYERTSEGRRAVVGEDARARASEFPHTTVASAKRLMGRSVEDCAPDLPYLGYTVVAGEHNTARIALPLGDPPGGADADPEIVSPQEVSAAILAELRARAESVLGRPVSKAVVTVPAYFDDAQRQATRDAGRIAGLEVVRIVNEPTAAALAYGLGTAREAARNEGPRHVAVYDLGGGTFDISVLRITPADGGGGTAFYQVLSTAGDTRLGGDDIDNAIVRTLTDGIGVELGSGGGLPAESRRAIAAFARAVKHRLSDEDTAAVRIDLGGGRVYERTLTRAELEAMMAPMIDKTIVACERSLRDARDALDGAPIDSVVLVGGSTRIPLVRARVGAFFGIEPYTALDPDTVVALGAAVQGAILAGDHRGLAAAGCHPPEPGHRDARRRGREADHAQQPGAGARDRDASRPASTGRCRSSSMCCRASARWPRTAGAWASSISRGCPRCPRASPSSRSGFSWTRTAC